MDSLDLSIVVPLYNEEGNVKLLHTAIVDAMERTSLKYEVLLVDDGSRDATFRCAAELVDLDERVRVIAFRRNYGQTAATAAGIQNARGKVIVTMDGDLQNDPTDIPRLLAVLDNGHHIVVGWRRKRMDEGMRVFMSKIANRIMGYVLGVAIRDTGCSLKAYRAELIQGLPLYGEMHRFIPALSKLVGAKLAQIEVAHHPRRFGVSKYGFARVYKVLLDIISIRVLLSYARRPLLWHGSFTAVICAVGVAVALTSILFAKPENVLISAAIGTLLVALGLFLGFMGVIGQLLAMSEPDFSRFASLAATLSSRVAPQNRLEEGG